MRHEFGIEDVFRKKVVTETVQEPLSESDAEAELERLLALPENKFLTEVTVNRIQIEAADSAITALEFAQQRIHQRVESTLAIRKAVHGHLESIHANAEAVVTTISEVLAHAHPIGKGADGRVVIDTRGAYALNPEVCYKFALEETVKRGRNSMIEEMEIQSAFHEAATTLTDKRIGVPEPYFEVDIGSSHMIVMEKLYARSVDDILRGFGTLPEGFDVDAFCDALRSFIDAMHEQHLYHRDLHYGNIMIHQPGEVAAEGKESPMGYVIDFGLSGYAYADMDPYKKELAGMTFTYDQDHGRIESVRSDLKSFQDRQRGK